MSNPRGAYSDRGAYRGGRGGGRGRGRGGALVNFQAVAMDYDSAPVPKPAFTSVPSTPFMPKPASSVPYLPSPAHTPSTSGYNTPRRGLAFTPGSSGSFRGSGGRSDDRGSSRGGRGDFGRGGGRGGRGGSGGLGFLAQGNLLAGVDRPLLVPVAFVRASALPVGLGGSEDDVIDNSVPGELDTRVLNGGLIEIVRELDMESSSEEEDSMVEDSMIAQAGTDTLIDFNQLYVSDVTPSIPSDVITISHHAESTFVLGLSKKDDSDSEEEEIVFQPTAPIVVPNDILPPVAIVAVTSVVVVATAPIALVVPPSLPLSNPNPASAPTAPHSPVLRDKPLTKNQKRQLKKAGKKARKNGTSHPRAGNQHLFVNAPPDSDDEDLEPEALAGDDGIEEMGTSKPREGDSDLDWGEQGPGPEEAARHKDRGTGRKARRKLERGQTQETQRIERLSVGARSEVAFALRKDVAVVSQHDVVPLRAPKRTRGGRRGNQELDEAALDYARNVFGLKSAGNSPTSSELGGEDHVNDMGFLLRMDGTSGGAQVSIAELEDDRKAREEDGEGWRTTDEEALSDESSDEADSDDELEMDIALGEADAAVDIAIAKAEDDELGISNSDFSSSDEEEASRQIAESLLAGGTVRFSSMDVGGPGGRRGRKEKKQARKGKGKFVDGVSSTDEDDSDADMFEGNNTWADNDEDYIRGLQDILNDNAHLLDSGNRKQRNKMFKAINNGDFSAYDKFEDDFSFASGSGRKSKGKPSSSGTFADSLQAQWSADRAKKGDYKRNRALARAEAQEAAPWASKKSSKAPSPVAGVNSSDVATINHQIREWLMHQIGKPALSLPPMSKKSRVAVHLLGEVYGLKTKSLGKGSMRFPVLERGSKSGVFGVDERRVQAIIATAEGDPRGAYGKGAAAGSSKARGKMGGLWAALEGRPAGSGRKSGGGGGGGGGNDANRNREGAVVGQGADKLGEGNVGYELLKRMGWTAGTLIGSSGGIEEPIVARVKMSKGGLGSGYSVTRAEAQGMGRSGY